MRNSNQRNLVYDIVITSCDHPTAEVIYQRAREKMPKISLGTVYRNLNELVELKKIIRITVPGDSDHFDKTLHTHAHLFCKGCQNLIDIMNQDVSKLINDIEISNGIKVISGDITFHGICSKCQQN